MEAKFQSYDHVASHDRIKEILDSAEKFEEVNEIPGRDKLTYSNGFYVNCTALFIDIRRSSQLPDKHNRPVLGKIYRSYLSECVAVINGNPNCCEIFINSDCVSGVFNTPYMTDIDLSLWTAARLNSLINILNWRLEKKGYASIRCGIGLAYGRALMLKAAYKGSGINDVIWMGDVVNEASNLCHQGNRGTRCPLQVSTTIYSNLNDDNKRLLKPVYHTNHWTIDQYEGDIVNTIMNQWLIDQKVKDTTRSMLNSYPLYGQGWR